MIYICFFLILLNAVDGWGHYRTDAVRAWAAKEVDTQMYAELRPLQNIQEVAPLQIPALKVAKMVLFLEALGGRASVGTRMDKSALERHVDFLLTGSRAKSAYVVRSLDASFADQISSAVTYSSDFLPVLLSEYIRFFSEKKRMLLLPTLLVQKGEVSQAVAAKGVEGAQAVEKLPTLLEQKEVAEAKDGKGAQAVESPIEKAINAYPVSQYFWKKDAILTAKSVVIGPALAESDSYFLHILATSLGYLEGDVIPYFNVVGDVWIFNKMIMPSDFFGYDNASSMGLTCSLLDKLGAHHGLQSRLLSKTLCHVDFFSANGDDGVVKIVLKLGVKKSQSSPEVKTIQYRVCMDEFSMISGHHKDLSRCLDRFLLKVAPRPIETESLKQDAVYAVLHRCAAFAFLTCEKDIDFEKFDSFKTTLRNFKKDIRWGRSLIDLDAFDEMGIAYDTLGVLFRLGVLQVSDLIEGDHFVTGVHPNVLYFLATLISAHAHDVCTPGKYEQVAGILAATHMGLLSRVASTLQSFFVLYSSPENFDFSDEISRPVTGAQGLLRSLLVYHTAYVGRLTNDLNARLIATMHFLFGVHDVSWNFGYLRGPHGTPLADIVADEKERWLKMEGDLKWFFTAFTTDSIPRHMLAFYSFVSRKFWSDQHLATTAASYASVGSVLDGISGFKAEYTRYVDEKKKLVVKRKRQDKMPEKWREYEN